MPQIQSSDSYSDEPDSGWFNKNIPLSTNYYGVQKVRPLTIYHLSDTVVDIFPLFYLRMCPLTLFHRMLHCRWCLQWDR